MEYVSAREKLKSPIEKAVKTINTVSGKDPAIMREAVLNKMGINLKEFYPVIENGKADDSNIAFKVKDGKLYDLQLGNYQIIPLTYPDERKAFPHDQRFLVLHGCDFIFLLFVKLREVNQKIVYNGNGIWAYKNDSELYTDKEMSKRMVAKLEAEKKDLIEELEVYMAAFERACLGSNITHEALQYLIAELRSYSF